MFRYSILSIAVVAACLSACATKQELRDEADVNEQLATEWRRNDNPDLDKFFSKRAKNLRSQADAITPLDDALSELMQGLFDVLADSRSKTGPRTR